MDKITNLAEYRVNKSMDLFDNDLMLTLIEIAGQPALQVTLERDLAAILNEALRGGQVDNE